MDSDLKYLLSLGVSEADAARRMGATRIIHITHEEQEHED